MHQVHRYFSAAPVKRFTFHSPISSVDLHPFINNFVVGSSDIKDTYAHVYNFDTEKEIMTYKGHHGPVHSVAYSPDGNTIASGSEDGFLRLWEVV